MRVAGRNINDPVIRAPDRVLFYRLALDVAHADQGFTLDHEELLALGVMIVVAARDSGLRPGNENLPEMSLLDELRQATTLVGLDLKIVLTLRRRHVGKIGRVQRAIEPVGKVRGRQGLPHVVKGLNSPGQFAEPNAIGRNPGSGIAVLTSVADFVSKGRHNVINVTQFQFMAGSEMLMGRSFAMLWQKVAVTEL